MSDAVEALGLTEPTEQEQQEIVNEVAEANGQTEGEFLSQFVGEGKKYKDVESLAKAYHNIDKHAEIVKKENEEYRQELEALKAKEKTVEEIMSAINEPSPTQEKVDAPQIDITSEVEKVIQQKEQAQRIAEIQKQSQDKVIEAFGKEGALDAVKAYVQGDPNKDNIVKTLAQTDPNGLVNLLKSVETSSTEKPVVNTTGVSSKSITGTATGIEITWSQAREIRKENPEMYKKLQGKIHASADAADRLGIDYYGT